MEVNEKNDMTRLTSCESCSRIKEKHLSSTQLVPYEDIKAMVLKKKGDPNAGFKQKLMRCWNNTRPDTPDRRRVENILYTLECKRHRTWQDSLDRKVLTRLDKK